MSTITTYDRVGYGLNMSGAQFYGLEDGATWDIEYLRAIDSDTLEYRVTGSAFVSYQLISFTYNSLTRIITLTEFVYQDSNRLPLLTWTGMGLQKSIDDTSDFNDADFLGQIDSGITVYGNRYSDLINGGASADYISGLAGDDTLNGWAGSDTLLGGIGNDTLDGGLGLDKAVYSAASSVFRTIFDTNTFTLQGSPLTFGQDSVQQVEQIQFSDVTVDPSWFSKTLSLSAAQKTSLVELYIASFNRAPDAIGLNYWGGRLYDGMSLAEIARSFFVQPETVAAYPSSMPTQTFVTTVYNNVLSRAPDTEGLNYWVREIDTGNVSKDVFLLAIINGAKASSGSATDRQTLANKVAVGNHFAFDEGLNNTTWGIDVMDSVTHLASTVTDANALTTLYSAAITDTTAPTVATFNPIDGATDMAINSNVVVTFSEAILRGTGNIVLRSGSSTGTVVETFNAATSTRLTISDSTLTIDPTSNLSGNTQYFVTFASGSIKDLAGNSYAGTTTYDFRTKAPIVGTSGNDNLVGTTASDAINGGAGNDTITGGLGNDVMDGGDGVDGYIFANANEHVTAEINDSGTSDGDLIIFSATTPGTLMLFADDRGIESVWIATVALNNSGTTALNIDASAYTNELAIFGNAGPNLLVGSNIRNTLAGAGGNDTLIGGSGIDGFFGGEGNDVLTGGAGNDIFYFSHAPNALNNLDILNDFATGSDYIALDKADFSAFSSLSDYANILPGNFWSGAGVITAHDADDRIIYNTSTGALYYDADGTSATAPIQFAIMGSTIKPALTYGDFYVY